MSTKAKIPVSLEWEKDAVDGYEGITLGHQGCPILTVRGLDDMSRVDEEDEQDIVEQVCQTAIFVQKSYNHHQELVTRLYNLVNVLRTYNDATPAGKEALKLRILEAEETLKKVI